MDDESFEIMLTGGHPNSLGRTIEIVDLVLANPERLAELYACYFSEDEVVRLRTSNALKRISRERLEWLVPYIDKFIAEISVIEQASTQWTLADLFRSLEPFMTPSQKTNAMIVLKRNLEKSSDWIVLNTTMETLAVWSETDRSLKHWLRPHLEKLAGDPRKSVSKRAKRLLTANYLE